MTWRVGTPIVVFLAGALLSRTISFDSPRQAVARRDAVIITQPVPADVDGVRVFQVAEPPARETRRNLFAFIEDPPAARPATVVRRTLSPKIATPQVEQKSVVVQQDREPEFPMRFIGTFGMAKDPIAVFEANGDVVNAKVGDVVTGEFRLASIGLDSVEVSTPRATQRVALKR